MQKGTGNASLNHPITITDSKGSNKLVLKDRKEIAHEYLLALGLAHEVVSDVNKQGEKIYQGPSPDEITLVDAAR